MALDPEFATKPKIGAATLTTADASMTAPTTVVTVLTGAATGTRVSRLGIKGLGATTAGLVRWWLHDGANYTLIAERAVSAVAPNTTTPAFEETINEVTNPELLPIVLPNAAGWSIRATVSVNQTGLRVRAEGADL
jgi:hypothetical protein